MEVTIKCGEPTWREVIGYETRRRFLRYPWDSEWGDLPGYDYFEEEETVKVEKWTYNCGRNRFIQILTFRGGILKQVQDGDRGQGSYVSSDCVGAKKRRDRKPSSGK